MHFSVNAPFKPEVTSATDTSNFDVDDTEVKHTVSSWQISWAFQLSKDSEQCAPIKICCIKNSKHTYIHEKLNCWYWHEWNPIILFLLGIWGILLLLGILGDFVFVKNLGGFHTSYAITVMSEFERGQSLVISVFYYPTWGKMCVCVRVCVCVCVRKTKQYNGLWRNWEKVGKKPCPVCGEFWLLLLMNLLLFSRTQSHPLPTRLSRAITYRSLASPSPRTGKFSCSSSFLSFFLFCCCCFLSNLSLQDWGQTKDLLSFFFWCHFEPFKSLPLSFM